MAQQGETAAPATRRTRKSIGGGPSSRKTLDKENATLDVGSSAVGGTRKKSRSKSMGPGGLDALKTGTGNRRASLAVPPPRSILKPTMPILPDIPSFKPKQGGGSNSAAAEAGGTKVALRTEEEQQAAAREREERERAQMEKEIKDRREARRKSLANRRVSFAAEATLHTFHEIEEMHDSTTSSDSTRRASSIAARSAPQQQAGPAATAPDHAQDEAAESLPTANQADAHRGKRRRSSAASSMYGSDDTVASSVYDSDFDHADSVAEIQAVEMSDSSNDSDEDGTAMTVEAEEMTSASMASVRSGYSGDTSGSLDENLRLAARMAATQSVDEDEEVIAGFAGWGRKNPSQESTSQGNAMQTSAPDYNADDQGSEMEMDMDADADMDMTKAVGGILYPQLPSPDKNDEEDEEIDEEMSMDVTTALGGILSKAKAFLRRKSVLPQPEPSEFGDQTMDFTMAVGGIQQGRVSDASHMDLDGNEDMSMEFTTAVGGLLSGNFSKSISQNTRRRTVAAEDGEDEGMMMDMTMGVGRILPAEAEEEEEADQTMGMDMTMAVGGIIKSATTPEARSAARKVMEEEADEPRHPETATPQPESSPMRLAVSPAGENAASFSPFQGGGLRRTPPRQMSPVARSPARPSSSPMRQTPSPKRPSPKRTAVQPHRSPARSPAPMIGSRSSSPMRNLSSPAKATPRSPAKSLFHQDPSTGVNTPRVVLTPLGRRLSGVGADRSGLGSPRVAEIFDRRESIGDAAGDFVPSQPANPRRNVAFADPRELEAELDRERRDEQEKEEGFLDQDEREETPNLREMIQNLSPKKSFLRGRKSLHVGSALGLLGKRPAELDDEDEDSEQDGVKRLRGHQGSPVKNIRLQSPPSKAETTTGRKTRPSTRPTEGDTATPTASSPQRATTPRAQNRFLSVTRDQPTATFDFDDTVPMHDLRRDEDEDGDRIHLQDFLNMTSIRFMELTTTKRRHTVAPGASRGSTASDTKDDLSLESCVVAGACTVPMLELYQHSCRELKKYISEGRRIVREIETETFDENPPLFREYMTASPEFKVLMDNQFKNVKTHARLLSKAMWYEWRMKLQEGLREGLLKTVEGMDADEKLLGKQEALIASVLPGMVKRLEELELERENLEEVARELADCDPRDLEDARAELVAVDQGIADKTGQLAALRSELDEAGESVEALLKQKQQFLDEIREADRVREECRGWSAEEIGRLKAKTDALTAAHGWSILTIASTTLTMRYRSELELTFDTASPTLHTTATLRYLPPSTTPSPEKAFLLHHIRTRLLPALASSPSTVPPARALTKSVASAWSTADVLTEQIRRLGLSFPTSVSPTADNEGLAVTASVLLVPLQTRVEVVFTLGVVVENGGVGVTVEAEAGVVYGEPFQAGKMGEFLRGRVAGRVGDGGEGWWDGAVLELYGRLLAKGRARG